jgi:hypothetical protein
VATEGSFRGEVAMSHLIPLNRLEQVQELLHQRLHGRARDLRVVVRETRVVLQGVATCYYTKQVAQQLVFDALGAIALVNEIEVRRLVRHSWSDEEPTG